MADIPPEYVTKNLDLTTEILGDNPTPVDFCNKILRAFLKLSGYAMARNQVDAEVDGKVSQAKAAAASAQTSASSASTSKTQAQSSANTAIQKAGIATAAANTVGEAGQYVQQAVEAANTANTASAQAARANETALENSQIVLAAATKAKQYDVSAKESAERAERVLEQSDNWVENSQTVNVGPGEEFTSIRAAFDSFRGKQIKGWIIIKVADGTHDYTGIHLENQPYARQFRIYGNIANPEKCVINWVPDSKGYSHGFVVRGLQGIYISGFTMQGTVSADNLTWRSLRLDQASVVHSHTNSIRIKDGRRGIEVYDQSRLSCSGLIIEECSEWAMLAGSGSQIHSHNSRFIGRGADRNVRTPRYYTSGNDASHGITAVDGSQVWVGNAHVEKVWGAFRAERGAYLSCDRSTSKDNQYGFESRYQAVIQAISNADRVTAKNCTYGFFAEHNGFIRATGGSTNGALADNCTSGFFATKNSSIWCDHAEAKNCDIGFQAHRMSYIQANATNAKSTGNTTQYNPPQDDVPGNVGAIVEWS